jgi:hypothetical protein|tara:strand:- start:465 stop:647 length:183 start_codon:yes stop_codon:yes gene_type:complete
MNNKSLRNYTKQSKGLGDTIQKFTSITGLQKLTQLAVGKKVCGCNKRKEALNKAFPYKNK